MAQDTHCLHAIYNHMKKVKLKYQHVPYGHKYWCVTKLAKLTVCCQI